MHIFSSYIISGGSFFPGGIFKFSEIYSGVHFVVERRVCPSKFSPGGDSVRGEAMYCDTGTPDPKSYIARLQFGRSARLASPGNPQGIPRYNPLVPEIRIVL